MPAGLPLDDVGRKAALKGAQEVYEAGGEGALRKWVYDQFGDQADQIWGNIDKLTGWEYVLKPEVNSGQLHESLIKQLYKPSDHYLGGTAGILRRGTPEEIMKHMRKAEMRLTQMERILKSGMAGQGADRVRLNQHDLDIVQTLYDDLLDAYNGAKGLGY